MAIGGLLYRSFASSGGGGGVAVAPQTADECSQWGPGSVTDGIWWFVVPRVFHGAAASEGPAVRPGLVECPIAHARTQRGQVIVVVRGARDECVQPAAALGFQERAGGGEQAHGALRVVRQAGHRGQGLEVVRGTRLVSCLGRQGQPFRQVVCGGVQIAPGLAAERQVIQRDEDGQPVGRPAGRGQALGEQLRRRVGISLAEPGLPEVVVRLGGGLLTLYLLVRSELVILRLIQQARVSSSN